MIRTKFISILSFFFFFVVQQISAQPSLSPREMLRWKITMSDDLTSMNEARNEALANPVLLEEIVFLKKDETGNLSNRYARPNAMNYLEECSKSGQITPEHFFDIVFRLLKDLPTYALPSDLEEESKAYRQQVTTYGFNPISKKTSVDLFGNLQALLASLDAMFKYGQISNQGTLRSLKAKILSAKDFLEKEKANGKNPATNKLNATINEANAQKGKHIVEYGAEIIIGYCKGLIAQIADKTF